MVKWPGNFQSAEGVYAENEKFTFEGRYPVGKNGYWHSGIHIKFNKIYPMIEGWLVAYRLSENYEKVQRLREITTNEYNALPVAEKQLYDIDTTKRNTYKQKEPYQDEQYTKSFFLVRHRVPLPVTPQDKTPKPLEFFTFYTNIAPVAERREDYQPIDDIKSEAEIPFYEKFEFKIAEPHLEHKYAEVETKKLFLRSRCDFRYKDKDSCYCKFYNADKEIVLPINCIEIVYRPEYRTNTDTVIIYEASMSETEVEDDKEREKKKVSELKSYVYFKDKIEFIYKGADYVKVDVDPKERKDGSSADGIKEYIVRFNDLVLDTAGVGLFKGNGSIICNKGLKGILVCDSPDGYVLEAMEDGKEEIEFENPKEFWDNYNNSHQNQFIALKRTNDTERKRYLHFIRRPSGTSGEDLQARIVRKKEYDGHPCNTVIADNSDSGFELMDHDTLLGKPAGQVFPYLNYYDLVLLFDNVDFYNSPVLDGYRIPPGTALYKKTEESGKIEFKKDSDSSQEMAVIKYISEGSYFGFYYQGKLLYIPESQEERYKVKLLEWNKNFKKTRDIDKNVLRELYDRVVEMFSEIRKGIERAWQMDTEQNERPETKQIKRTLICRHPLEWDKDLYLENGAIRPQIRKDFGISSKQDHTNYFVNQVKAVDIWSELKGMKIEGLNLEENNFWFAHPVYFVNYLEKEGLLTAPRIRKLISIQDEVVALPCLEKGSGRGIYKQGKGGDTYCNHAAFLTILATDGNFKNFTNKNNSSFPELPGKEAAEYQKENNIKSSNFWCDELGRMADDGRLVKLSEPEAQSYGNMGYTVVAAYKAKNKKEWSPHFATVRPGYIYNQEKGIMLANVGEGNGIKRVNAGFGSEKRPEIKWYYNPNQSFKFNPNIVLDYLRYR